MPAALLLNEFGSKVWDAFGVPPYHVGSSLTNGNWRDVDVRVILGDVEYKEMELGDPERQHENSKWVALVLAFSCLGREMTGLPIDFQIQQQTLANKLYPSPANQRSYIGNIPLRIKNL